MHPTAPMSPSLSFFTSRPTFTTLPTISCPETQGYTVGMTICHSSRVWCRSEWHTPQIQYFDLDIPRQRRPPLKAKRSQSRPRALRRISLGWKSPWLLSLHGCFFRCFFLLLEVIETLQLGQITILLVCSRGRSPFDASHFKEDAKKRKGSAVFRRAPSLSNNDHSGANDHPHSTVILSGAKDLNREGSRKSDVDSL